MKTKKGSSEEQIFLFHPTRRPKEWLFPGTKPHKPVASYTINRLIKGHASLLGMEVNVTPHLFRQYGE